jgi:hypothetical protein
MSVVKSLIAGSILLLLGGSVAADNLFAQAEATGSVSSVFPEAGVILINGARYTLAEDVQVIADNGSAIEGGVKSLTSGMPIEYGFSQVKGKSVVSVIIVTGDTQ